MIVLNVDSCGVGSRKMTIRGIGSSVGGGLNYGIPHHRFEGSHTPTYEHQGHLKAIWVQMPESSIKDEIGDKFDRRHVIRGISTDPMAERIDTTGFRNFVLQLKDRLRNNEGDYSDADMRVLKEGWLDLLAEVALIGGNDGITQALAQMSLIEERPGFHHYASRKMTGSDLKAASLSGLQEMLARSEEMQNSLKDQYLKCRDEMRNYRLIEDQITAINQAIDAKKFEAQEIEQAGPIEGRAGPTKRGLDKQGNPNPAYWTAKELRGELEDMYDYAPKTIRSFFHREYPPKYLENLQNARS